jgi:hypothetical protein
MNNNLVITTKGLVEREALTVKDVISEEDSARVTATEWYLGEELVRRDVNVNILRGLETPNDQQSF